MLISAGFLSCAEAQPLLQEAAAKEYPEIKLADNDRILVLAPHPDDEVLGCAGIIQKAVAMKLPVKVVFYTYGDNNEWAFLIYHKRPVILPGAVRSMGMMRHDEAVEAAKVLGLSADQLVFLGYPDFGTMNIWYDHWGDRPAVRAMLTKARAVPYANALRPGAAYRGQEVLRDLKYVIREFKPTKIFLSHPADHNVDHRSLNLFTTVALWELGMGGQVETFPYLVHYVSWPMPRGFLPDQEILPPQRHKIDVEWSMNMLSAEEIDVKKKALLKHKSEYDSAKVYLESFIRANELFGDFPRIALKERNRFFDIGADRLEEIRELSEEYLDSQHASFIGLEQRSVQAKNGDLVLTVLMSRKVSREVGVSVYLFGFREGVPFEQMPKIHVRYGALFHAAYDQNKQLGLSASGIKLTRKKNKIILTVPLKTLGNPQKILTSANTYLGKVPLDWVSWRIIELPPKSP